MDHIAVTGTTKQVPGRHPSHCTNGFALFLRLWPVHRRILLCVKQEVVNVFVHQFALVDEPIAEPDINRVEPTHHAQTHQTHFFANLANGAVFVRFSLANVALRERPLSVRVLHHGKVYQAVDALKHEASSRDLCAMTFFLALIPS